MTYLILNNLNFDFKLALLPNLFALFINSEVPALIYFFGLLLLLKTESVTNMFLQFSGNYLASDSDLYYLLSIKPVILT